MKIQGIPFYQANATNFSRGRTRPIRFITVHHSAGWEQTLRYLWADPNRNASSHFWVGNGHVEQYVDTDDTAWTNGNFDSNSESITIEVRGDWRGYYDQATLNQLETLLQKLRKAYPQTQITYHMDVTSSSTLCPADLKHKGYARQVWDRVTAWLSPPVAPKPVITYKKIAPKRVQLIRGANLWNFNFTAWANAKPVGSYSQGHIVDVVAVAKNALGAEYYMTAYSYNDGNVRATNGFNVADVKDYAPAITEPPKVVPFWEQMTKARKLRTLQPTFVVNLDIMKNEGVEIPAGKEIDFVEKQTLSNNVMYLRSKWAKENQKNWGVRMDILEEIIEVPREPIPEPPINVDPTVPTPSDIEKRLTALEKLVQMIVDFLQKIFSGFNK